MEEKIDIYLPTNTPIRVATYCNIVKKTENANQVSDFITAQKQYYQEIIGKQPNWIYSGIYIDECRKCRKQFNNMIADAKSGKFDLIITKNISRFCRNTIECVDIIRNLLRLKKPVGVYFESQSLFTLHPQAEYMISMLPMVAEIESKIRSEAMKTSWRIRKERAKYEK
jgi:DNA invertase Pin-like site-specific DNA recombinase